MKKAEGVDGGKFGAPFVGGIGRGKPIWGGKIGREDVGAGGVSEKHELPVS